MTWLNAGIAARTNCYAYALNCPDTGTAYPGRLSEYFYSNIDGPITSQNIARLLKKDGLIEISKYDALNSGGHVIAVRIDEGSDFHMIRRDKKLKWSWKGVGRRPFFQDLNGQTIRNPEDAYFPDHPDFLGYYRIPYGGILYVPR